MAHSPPSDAFGRRRLLPAPGATTPARPLPPPVLEPLLQPRLLRIRAALRRTTDSEHLFRFLLSERDRCPRARPLTVLREVLRRVLAWSREVDPEARPGL